MAIQTLTLNVNAQPSAEDRAFLYLSQNENGRDIRFRVLGDDLPSGCTATLSGVKPDGNVWSKAGTVTNNFVVVEEDIQMTAVAGRWDAQLDIVNGSKNIVTALIRITVEAAAVEAGAVPSDTQLEGYVEQCKQYAETAKNEAYGSPLTAATAAAMTDQSRVYVYTGSETGYTAGHWYYHNGTSWTDGGVYNAVAVDTDTTLSVSGKAADAKKTGDELSTIKEDLSDKLNFPLYDTYNEDAVTDGRYLNSSGTEVTQGGWSITDFMKVGRVAKYNIKSSSSASVYCWFYDAQKQLLSPFQTLTKGENGVDAPKGAYYVRFSIKTAEKSDFTYSSFIDPFADEYVQPNALALVQETATYKDELIAGSYYAQTGAIVTNANWTRTKLYNVDEGDVITVSGAQASYAIGFASDGTVSTYKEYNGSNPKFMTFIVDANTKTVGFNIQNVNLDIFDAKINGRPVGVKYAIPWLYMDVVVPSIWKNKNYISHGDSVTWQDGKAYQQGAHIGEIAKGYQTVFSGSVDLAGYNNQGRSGYPMALYNDYGCVKTITNIANYTPYDLCTIACGTNDFKLNIPLGTLGMIGDTSFDDSTFYGAFRKAVEHILASSPTIRLVLMTPLQRDNSGYDVNHINTAGHKLIDYVNAIKDIGEMYGLPVCDMYANSGFTKKTLSTYTMDGLHPNDVGYERMGGYLTGFLNAIGN